MFETYKMLGAEREAELLRDAQRLRVLPPSRLWAWLSAVFSVARRTAHPELSGTLSPLELARPTAEDEAA
jgi:hypothetical protein